MGYNTRYGLSSVFKPFSEYEDHARSNGDIDYILSEGRGKWYDHDYDMKALSKLFPDEVFILRGIGEEFPDVWRKAYKDGQVYTSQATITFPEINVPGCTVREVTVNATR